MHAKQDERQGGAVNQKAFERVIRDNLSPEGIATIIAFLQPAAFYRPPEGELREQQLQGLRQAEWLADTLMELLGVDEFNRLIEKLGL